MDIKNFFAELKRHSIEVSKEEEAIKYCESLLEQGGKFQDIIGKLSSNGRVDGINFIGKRLDKETDQDRALLFNFLGLWGINGSISTNIYHNIQREEVEDSLSGDEKNIKEERVEYYIDKKLIIFSIAAFALLTFLVWVLFI